MQRIRYLHDRHLATLSIPISRDPQEVRLRETYFHASSTLVHRSAVLSRGICKAYSQLAVPGSDQAGFVLPRHNAFLQRDGGNHKTRWLFHAYSFFYSTQVSSRSINNFILLAAMM